ncbi:hypothetical protein EMIT0P74_60256 [Pseudomonas sp. IT-P74]
MWGEPVTFLVARLSIRRAQHDVRQGVKPKPKALEPPGFMRYLQHLAVNWKKSVTKHEFVHACCIDTQYRPSGTRWKRRPSGKKNSGKVARWRFKRFTRTLFTDDKAQKTALKLSALLRRSWKFATSTMLFATGS